MALPRRDRRLRLAQRVLASVVPAWLASRQDVVAVLAGRRGDRSPRASTPVFGLVLLGVGIAVSVVRRGRAPTAATVPSGSPRRHGVGARDDPGRAGRGVAVARLRGRFPLTVRYAARDAARHRTRTVPAVAAVAATVAGVVALGIANTSDEAQNERPTRPAGDGRRRPSASAPDGAARRGPAGPGAVWDRVDAACAEPHRTSTSSVVRGPDDRTTADGYTRRRSSCRPRRWSGSCGGVHGPPWRRRRPPRPGLDEATADVWTPRWRRDGRWCSPRGRSRPTR